MSRSHTDTPHAEHSSVRVKSLPDTQHAQQTDSHRPDGIRTCNPCKRVAVDPGLRSRGYWEQPVGGYLSRK